MVDWTRHFKSSTTGVWAQWSVKTFRVHEVTKVFFPSKSHGSYIDWSLSYIQMAKATRFLKRTSTAAKAKFSLAYISKYSYLKINELKEAFKHKGHANKINNIFAKDKISKISPFKKAFQWHSYVQRISNNCTCHATESRFLKNHSG